MSRRLHHGLLWPILAALLLAACNHTPPAPPGGRSGSAQNYQPTREGHYRVRRGDSLHAIAFRYGLDWRDIAHWNDIGSPWIIHPDQQLRITPPDGVRPAIDRRTDIVADARLEQPHRSAGETASGVQTSGRSEPEPARTVDVAARSTTRPMEDSPAPAKSSSGPRNSGSNSGKSSTSRSSPSANPTPTSSKSGSGKDPETWLWPTRGRVVSNFRLDDPARKGIDISGTKGQPVVSAAAGQVVYSGNGLIGYGELIIIKHSARLLSAYAHNSRRLVNEGDKVDAGQHIAAMGTDERKDPVLHFEIRVNGKPSDPLKYLSR